MLLCELLMNYNWHLCACNDDVIKWKQFPRYWPFVRGINRSPVNCPHKGQWRGALVFSLICAWINGSVNNCEARDLRRRRAHYDVDVISSDSEVCLPTHSGNRNKVGYTYCPVICYITLSMIRNTVVRYGVPYMDSRFRYKGTSFIWEKYLKTACLYCIISIDVCITMPSHNSIYDISKPKWTWVYCGCYLFHQMPLVPCPVTIFHG